MTPQLPLTLRAPPDQRFDAFHGADPVRDAVHAAARLVSADRAAHARRRNAMVDAFSSVLKRARDVPGL